MKIQPLLIALIATCLWACSSNEQKNDRQSVNSHHIDHLIVAINNLDSGIAKFEKMTGVKPIIGGEHPGRGTHNALVALSDKTYMEIIAPRQDLDSTEYILSENLLAYEELTPIGWAVNSTDIEGTRTQVQNLGLPVSEPASGSRIKPDGTELSWTTFRINDERFSAVPFFIEWGEGSAHPASTSPRGIKIKSVIITSSQYDQLNELVNNLGLSVVVKNDKKTSISIVLTTPEGEIALP